MVLCAVRRRADGVETHLSEKKGPGSNAIVSDDYSCLDEITVAIATVATVAQLIRYSINHPIVSHPI